MTGSSVTAIDRSPSSITESITALLVTDDESRYGAQLEAALEDDDGLTIQTVSSRTDALARLADVDCLVSEYALMTANESESGNGSVAENGTALLERVREREPELPTILLVGDAAESTAVVDATRSHRWTDCMARRTATTVPEQLGHRIRTLVEHRRLTDLSRRSLASVELAQDAVAVAAPDGSLEFANRSYAMQFGYDREDLPGTSWRALFTDDSVERLEMTAIPTVADGWRWTGTCTGRRKTGETVDVRVRLGGLEDGSLVFVVDTPTADTSDESA